VSLEKFELGALLQLILSEASTFLELVEPSNVAK
jgi:hypothetical protein